MSLHRLVQGAMLGWALSSTPSSAKSPGQANSLPEGSYQTLTENEVEGAFTGLGKFARPGWLYKGEWVDGHFNGTGYLVMRDPVHELHFKYFGNFLLGRFHGQGAIDFEDGTGYKGSWVNQVPHGRGLFRDAEGRIHEIDFDHGVGLFKKEGQTFECEWKSNHFELRKWERPADEARLSAENHSTRDLDPRTVLESEKFRLRNEMTAHLNRLQPQGAERTYQEILALNLQLDSQTHIYGAEAALALGHVDEAYSRLKQALAVSNDPAIKLQIEDIDASYGRVVLSAEDSVNGTELRAKTLPFSSYERHAIEYAQRKLAEDHSFEGRLPVGVYSFGGKEFEVKNP